MMYEADMEWTETRHFTATAISIEVPDDIPEDQVEAWIADNIWVEGNPYAHSDDGYIDEIENDEVLEVRAI